MIELLKRSFALFVKNRRLKIINKECDRYNKIKNKLFRQQCTVNALLERYKEIYNEDLRTPKEGVEENGNNGEERKSKMKFIKIYEYYLSEDEIKEAISVWFNKNTEKLALKSDIKIEYDKQPYCEPTVKATITIEEEGK